MNTNREQWAALYKHHGVEAMEPVVAQADEEAALEGVEIGSDRWYELALETFAAMQEHQS